MVMALPKKDTKFYYYSAYTPITPANEYHTISVKILEKGSQGDIAECKRISHDLLCLPRRDDRHHALRAYCG